MQDYQPLGVSKKPAPGQDDGWDCQIVNQIKMEGSVTSHAHHRERERLKENKHKCSDMIMPKPRGKRQATTFSTLGLLSALHLSGIQLWRSGMASN